MRQQKQCIRIAGSKTKLDNEFKEQQVKLLGSIFFFVSYFPIWRLWAIFNYRIFQETGILFSDKST